MKVKELMAKLQSLPPDYEVLFDYHEPVIDAIVVGNTIELKSDPIDEKEEQIRSMYYDYKNGKYVSEDKFWKDVAMKELGYLEISCYLGTDALQKYYAFERKPLFKYNGEKCSAVDIIQYLSDSVVDKYSTAFLCAKENGGILL